MPKRAQTLKKMEEVHRLVEGMTDADTANQTTPEFKKISHALTSEVECRAIVSAKIKELGLTYDAKAQAYVAKGE